MVLNRLIYGTQPFFFFLTNKTLSSSQSKQHMKNPQIVCSLRTSVQTVYYLETTSIGKRQHVENGHNPHRHDNPREIAS